MLFGKQKCNIMKSSKFICVECGTEFEATQTAKYCSQACKAKHTYGDHKIEGIKKELECLKAEVKSRNEAGTPDRETRTEGVWQQASGATHTGRADSVISPHEAAAPCDHGEKIC